MTEDPGLNLEHLQMLRGRQRLAAGWSSDRLERIAAHLETNDGFVAWSGGKDSTVVVDMAIQVDPHVPVVVYDSGLLFPETVAYIRHLATEWRLDLHWIRAEPDLLTIFAASGGWDMNAPDRELKGQIGDVLIREPAAKAHARFGRGSLWGVRAEEEKGRVHLYRTALAEATRQHPQLTREQTRARYGGMITRQDGTVTYGPIWDWSRTDVFQYLHSRRIPPNPLYAALAAAGAPEHRIRVDSILDAGHLSHGEMAWLQKGWPSLFDSLAAVLPRLREWT